MHQERQFTLVESLARLFMVNVTDESAVTAMKGDGDKGDDEVSRARRWFMNSILRDATPTWRVELRDVKEPAPAEDPLMDLDPSVAAAIVSAMQAEDLDEAARAVIYPAYGRIHATAKVLA